jgi:hypothetical protein
LLLLYYTRKSVFSKFSSQKIQNHKKPLKNRAFWRKKPLVLPAGTSVWPAGTKVWPAKQGIWRAKPFIPPAKQGIWRAKPFIPLARKAVGRAESSGLRWQVWR